MAKQIISKRGQKGCHVKCL